MTGEKKRERGNVALLAALLILPTIALLGGAIDLSRAIQQRIELQKAVDAAVLAASSLTNERDMEEVARDYLRTNLATASINYEDLNLSVQAVEDGEGRRVIVAADYDLDTMFLPLLNINSLDVSARSGGRQDWQQVEISMVLDVSLSMQIYGTRIQDLRDAGEDFIDAVMTEEVKDLTSISIVPFGTYVRVGEEFEPFLTNVDANTDSDWSDGHKWRGCMNLREEHFTLDPWAEDSIEPIPEDPGGDNCLPEPSEAKYLSNNNGTLTSAMAALQVGGMKSGYTSIDEGTLIGLKALAPDMRGYFGGPFSSTRPTDYHSGTLKVLIVMSDGDMSKQPRYCQPTTNTWTGWKYIYGSWHWGTWTDTVECTETVMDNGEAEAKMLELCDAGADNGVIVFTIGFGVSSGSAADQVLSACASTSANYFRVEETDIDSAFEAIAANINRVRIYM